MLMKTLAVMAIAASQLYMPAFAQQNPDRTTRVFQGTALVLDAIGPSQSRKGDTGDFKKINAGDIVSEQSTVKTGDNAAVLLKFNGGHLFRIGEKTTVTLKELGNAKQFSFQVLAGNIWSVVRKASQPAKYEVETPSVVAGVSGTIFEVSHDPDENTSSVSTNVGQVDVQQFDEQHNRVADKAHVGGGQFLELHHERSVAVKGPGAPAPGAARSVQAMVVHAQSPAHRQMWQTMRQQEPMFQPMARPEQFKLSPKMETTLRPTLFRRANPDLGRKTGAPNTPGGRRGPGMGGVNRPGTNRPGMNGNGTNRTGINRLGGRGTGTDKPNGAGKTDGKIGHGKPLTGKPGVGVAGNEKPGIHTESGKPGSNAAHKRGAKKPPIRKPGVKTLSDPKHNPGKPADKKTDP